MKKKPTLIPKEVETVLEKLAKAGYEAYIVGGCVRDLLMGAEPKDWDVATNAKPEEIQKVFPDSFYANAFGTVTVKLKAKSRQGRISQRAGEKRKTRIDEIEVTTYRIDEKYTDKRHPDAVKFAKHLEEDLSRRDFTINAFAMSRDGEIIDRFEGKEDLKNKTIRAVGDPEKRFSEDALRMMRAVRFATTLRFDIERNTLEAIKRHAGLLHFISKERVRDEFLKIIEAREAMKGIELLEEAGVLEYIVPELREGIGVGQNKHHIYTVWEHNVRALDWAAKEGYTTDVRVASLFHDIGKPRTKEGEGPDSTFYAHQVVGAKMAMAAMNRLKFPRDQTERVSSLIRNHMFVYNVGEVTERSVRRLVSKVGLENMDDLINLRIADRKGSGVPKAQPYRLRHFRYMVDKVSRDPVSSKMVKMKGDEIMKILGIEPGPKVGWVIAILLDAVLDDPKRNTGEYLAQLVRKLGVLKEQELEKRARDAKQKIDAVGEGIEEEAKAKYWVK